MDADSKFEDKMMKLLIAQAIIVIINLAFGWWLSCIICMLSMFFVPLLLIRKDLHNIHQEIRESNIIQNESNYIKINKEIQARYNSEIPK